MAEAVSPPPERSEHAPRFAAVIGALVGIAIGAVALAAVLISHGAPGPARDWSAWAPSTNGIAAAQQIADHVGPEYQLDSGQIVAVTGGGLEFGTLPAHIAVRAGKTISIVTGKTVLYTLCGTSTQCTVGGRPSLQRALLLNREALELALYTLHYMPDVDNVVALMPPSVVVKVSRTAKGQLRTTPVSNKRTTMALLLRRDQLATALHDPLAATLSEATPSAQTVAVAPETRLVNAVTLPNLYPSSIVDGQDASVFLVLDRSSAK